MYKVRTIKERRKFMINLLEYDRVYIWHPYASLKDPPPVRLVVSADGLELKIADGRKLLDGVASWWCVAHGHNHPLIVEAIRKQSEKLSHVMFGGFTHEPAIELAERLAKIMPKGLNRVFFADSGSISVEVACKMAVQYQNALGHPEKRRFVALKGGYHGDTSLCMALSDPDGMHTLFKGIMTKHFFARKPSCHFGAKYNGKDFASLEKIFSKHKDKIAAVVLEPVFQAANAMNFYHPNYLKDVKRLCEENGALLIFDEIAAGFYRTGPLWAHLHANLNSAQKNSQNERPLQTEETLVPDIMTVGKALTGGHLSLAAAIASEKVAKTISAGRPSAFMHGPTYMANPLACAAALASLELFQKENYSLKVKEIETQFKKELKAAKKLPNVRATRVLGAAAIIEVKQLPARKEIERVINEHNVWLRPFANFIYAMPPLVADTNSIKRISAALLDLAAAPPGPLPEDSNFHE